MAYETTLSAGGPANFTSPNTLYEAEGVGITFLSVDYVGGNMAGETTFPLASANTAGLQLVSEAIQAQGVNILGRGVLANSGTEMTFMVRSDSLDTISSTTTVAAIQAAIQALNANAKITATISSATAASRGLSDTETQAD